MHWERTSPDIPGKADRPQGVQALQRILVVLANPKGTDTLRLDAEARAIRESVALSPNRDGIELRLLSAATIDDVRRALLSFPCEIIHFSGHGTDGGLVLEDNLGAAKIVRPEALAELLVAHAPPLSCAVLNACYGDTTGYPASDGVPYTVLSGGSIADPDAIEFSKGFYDAIGAGKDVPFAYQEGCRTIALAHQGRATMPLLIKSTELILSEVLCSCRSPRRIESSNQQASWPRGDSLKALRLAVQLARYDRSRALTSRHILLALLSLPDGVTTEVIASVGGDIPQMCHQITSSIDKTDVPASTLRLTKSVQEIITHLDELCEDSGPTDNDDGDFLQAMLETQSESATVEELLSDLAVTRSHLLNRLVSVRMQQASTPKRRLNSE